MLTRALKADSEVESFPRWSFKGVKKAMRFSNKKKRVPTVIGHSRPRFINIDRNQSFFECGLSEKGQQIKSACLQSRHIRGRKADFGTKWCRLKKKKREKIVVFNHLSFNQNNVALLFLSVMHVIHSCLLAHQGCLSLIALPGLGLKNKTEMSFIMVKSNKRKFHNVISDHIEVHQSNFASLSASPNKPFGSKRLELFRSL